MLSLQRQNDSEQSDNEFKLWVEGLTKPREEMETKVQEAGANPGRLLISVRVRSPPSHFTEGNPEVVLHSDAAAWSSTCPVVIMIISWAWVLTLEDTGKASGDGKRVWRQQAGR